MPLVKATGCGTLDVPICTLPKFSEVGKRLGSVVPVPFKLTVCGLPSALSSTVTVPVCGPIAFGEKVTLIVQVEPAATPLPQLSTSTKSPLSSMPAMCTGLVSLLSRATLCTGLLVPTCWGAKFKLEASRESAGVETIFEAKASL